jgi:integrase
VPYHRTYTAKDGSKRVTWYTDIRLRKNGVPTGERWRKRIPNVRNITEARKAEAKIADALLYGEPETEAPLLSTYLETTFLQWARQNKAAPQLDARTVRVLCASPSLQGRRLDEVSVIQIEGFKRERRAATSKSGRPYKLSSLNVELVILSRAFRLAVDAGLVRSNPVRLVGRFEPDAAPFRVLLPEEESRLWRALSAGPSYLLPLARLALLTGMREGELLALEKSSVDFRRDVLFVVNPKWKQDRRKTEGLPFGRGARELLLELCARVGSGLLFRDESSARLTPSAVSNRFRRLTRRAGLTSLKFHSLRHTFGSRLGEAGRSPYEIARLMGHSDIKTSMTYVHMAGMQLREALESVAGAASGQRADTKISGAG